MIVTEDEARTYVAGLSDAAGMARLETFAALVLFGGAQMAFRSAVMTVFQTEVPDRLRGRVVSVLGMDFALWSLGGVAVGALGDLLAARHGGPPDTARAWGLHVALSLAGVACLAVMALTRGPMLHPPDPKAG